MNVKIDTKEKFSVITLTEAVLPANMTDELRETLARVESGATPHMVLNMAGVEAVSAEIATELSRSQQKAYEQGHSFVICCLQEGVEKTLDELELLEFMNVTPTESEAWDIVQMEEIERELLNDFDENEP